MRGRRSNLSSSSSSLFFLLFPSHAAFVLGEGRRRGCERRRLFLSSSTPLGVRWGREKARQILTTTALAAAAPSLPPSFPSFVRTEATPSAGHRCHYNLFFLSLPPSFLLSPSLPTFYGFVCDKGVRFTLGKIISSVCCSSAQEKS